MERIGVRAPNGLVSGTLIGRSVAGRGLIVCIHGGGCHSAYFEMTRPSIVELAVALEYEVLLVDRPGVAGNEPLVGSRPIADSIAPIRDFIGQVSATYVPGLPVGLVGHSIGGAIALTLAAEPRGWRLGAVAVSGIGDEPPARVRVWKPDDADFDGSGAVEMAAYLLGAEGTYDWQALLRLRRVAAPWNTRERGEIVQNWPARWQALAPAIDVPVQLRLADGEKIWLTGQAVVDRMAARLVQAPVVDAAVLPGGGHLYELHRRGPELAHEQVTFLDRMLRQV